MEYIEDINNSNNIYFLVCFDKDKLIKIKYEELLLKPFKISEFEVNKKIEIYKFDKKNINLKDQDLKNVQMKLILEDSNEGNFEILIEKIKPDDNLFLFDFKFKRKTFFIEKYPSGQYILPHSKQYEIFRNLFERKDKNQVTDLVFYAGVMLSKAESYELSFFTTIFGDIVYIRELFDYSQLFNIKKISGLGLVSEDKLREAKILVNLNFDDPLSKMIKTKEKDKQEKQLNKMAIFLFYFNYHYQKEKIINLLQNQHYNIYIYKNLLENNSQFKKFNLPKICINKLITMAKNYEDLLTIISYNKDCLELLEIINENHKIFIGLYTENEKEYEKEKKVFNNKINLDNYIEKSIDDDMEKIKNQIEKLLSIEKESKIFFVYFSRKFIESYIGIYNDKDIDDLINLLQIIKMIKNDKLSYIHSIKLIHDKCLDYASKGKIKNINLLTFIENDDFLLKKKDKELPIPIDILNFDIDLVNDEFIEKWKKIKWLKIFEKQEEPFYIKVCKSVNEMKYFGKLFSLFDIYEKERDYSNQCLLKMKETYINLIENYNKEECPNIIDDTSNLLYYLNAKNISLKSFIKDLISNLFEDADMHKIYYNIYTNDKYNIFNDELKEEISEFYKKKENQFYINPLYLGFYIKYHEQLNEDDIFLINNYIVQENDIYNLKEVDNIKLLKIIIKSNLLDNQTISNYVEFTRGIATVVINEIIDGKIEFSQIEKFYFNHLENELFERIELISCLVQNEKIKNNSNYLKEIIETNIKNIHQLINDLEVIQKKIKTFYPNARKDDIKKIDEILQNIRKNEIFYYKKEEIKEKYEYYLNQKDLQNLNIDFKKGNIFFKIYYEEKSKIYKNNDLKIMQETENEIKTLINALKINSIKNINLNKLSTVLNKFSKDEIKNLGEEIDKLISQYEINSNIDKNKLVNEFLLVSKKNLIYESAENFLSFIEMSEVEQEEFTLINKTIVKYLKEPKDINVIELSLELLKNYDIKFEEDTNYKYIKILDIIKNKKDIVKFLLDITLKKCQDLIDYFDKNKLYKGDIPSLLVCKEFFDKYINKNNKDKDIIKNLINGISVSENLELNLKKLVSNFDVIYNMANLEDF